MIMNVITKLKCKCFVIKIAPNSHCGTHQLCVTNHNSGTNDETKKVNKTDR